MFKALSISIYFKVGILNPVQGRFAHGRVFSSEPVLTTSSGATAPMDST